MPNLYVTDRFSLHMLNDVMLLGNDGQVRITPVTEAHAQSVVASFDGLFLSVIRASDVRARAEENLDASFDSEVEQIRLGVDDIILVAMINSKNHDRKAISKWYEVKY